jgi:hypothetical protein
MVEDLTGAARHGKSTEAKVLIIADGAGNGWRSLG